MLLLEIAAFLLGLWLVIITIINAIRTFIMPRSQNAWLTRLVFRSIGRLLRFFAHSNREHRERDRILAYFAPTVLFTLPIIMLMMVLVGYTLMFWAVGVRPLYRAFSLSGSSLLTLGFTLTDDLPQLLLSFSEATIGLILVAALIGFLPTMYSAFSRREAFVTRLEVRAGTPPSPIEMIARLYRIGRIAHFEDMWVQWEEWFTELEETHTSLAPLNFYRSPHPDRSWVTAAGVILDASALFISAVDLPATGQSNICIRAGYIALRRIADFFKVPYNPDPKPGDPISITRQQFDNALEELASWGIPLKADRDQAWRDFSGWRVNYDVVLRRLARLTVAPPAMWVSD